MRVTKKQAKDEMFYNMFYQTGEMSSLFWLNYPDIYNKILEDIRR